MATNFLTTISDAFSWMKKSIKVSLKFVSNGLINNIPALHQIMAWRQPGAKPLSEQMIIIALMHFNASLGLSVPTTDFLITTRSKVEKDDFYIGYKNYLYIQNGFHKLNNKDWQSLKYISSNSSSYCESETRSRESGPNAFTWIIFQACHLGHWLLSHPVWYKGSGNTSIISHDMSVR